MTQQQFNEVFDSIFSRCREILFDKAKEYAGDGDRLKNFRIAAELQGETVIKSLGGMYAKHAVSVFDMIARHEKGERFSQDKWDEKIIDSMNYLILLEACLMENTGFYTGSDYAKYIADLGRIMESSD